MPIRLDLRPDLQTCIDYWHSESTRFLQALRVPPLLLLLPLSRFDPEDPLRKYTAPLLFQAGQTFDMPCFDGTHAIVMVQYRVAGMLFHRGATIHAGHYQTVLCTQRTAVSGAPEYQLHITCNRFVQDSAAPGMLGAQQAMASQIFVVLIVPTSLVDRPQEAGCCLFQGQRKGLAALTMWTKSGSDQPHRAEI